MLYFLADILHVLSTLSCLFQNKFICIAIIGSVVKTDIVQIHMFFTEETTNLNSGTFNEQIGYHIVSEFDPQGKKLRRLSSEIRGGKFHKVEMIHDRTGQDLMDVVAFQKHFDLAVCNALECTFENNHIMTVIKILNSTNMPSKQVGLANWRWLI